MTLKTSYSDPTYEFTINNTNGWKTLPLEADIYYSLGTKDKQNKTISYVGISPLNHTKTANKNILRQSFKDACDSNYKKAGLNGSRFTEVKINNLSGYLCFYEFKPTNIKASYYFKQYSLINKDAKKYDYIISISYPKNNQSEEKKVNQIINGFSAF